jgi:imidazolonepropionase-like amidohydrolase
MSAIVFKNVRIFDGTTVIPGLSDLRVSNKRIDSITPSHGPSRGQPGDRVIDGNGAFLMPGLIEAHAHLSWPSSVERIVSGMNLPSEELTLTTACNARILLDHGFTSAYSAGALSERIEAALASHINDGGMPGPRLIPSTVEREPPNDEQGAALAVGTVAEHGRGPDAVRAFVKASAQAGAKSIKFLLSGEDMLQAGGSQAVLYTEEEMRAAGEQAKESGVWLCAHAQAAEAIKMAVRNGFRVIYHCTHADQEALDLLESRRDTIFVGPAVGILQAALEANAPPHMDMTYMKRTAAEAIDLQRKLVRDLRKRGIRVLPGGDYGFPFNPNGRNAWDLELFMQHFGYSAEEALHAATKLGGELMGMGDELGQLKPGFLADILMIDGDPTVDVRILQDKRRLLAIMKDGAFHKHPKPSASVDAG